MTNKNDWLIYRNEQTNEIEKNLPLFEFIIKQPKTIDEFKCE